MPRFIIFALLLVARASFARASDAIYCVKEGDNLSAIARQKLGTPIYGKNGSLERLLQANPNLKKEDFIYTDQAIFFVDGNRDATKDCSAPPTPARETAPLASSDVRSTLPLNPERQLRLRLSVGNALLVSKFDSVLADATVSIASLFTPSVKAELCNSSEQCLHLGFQKILYRLPGGYSSGENGFVFGLDLSLKIYESGSHHLKLKAGIQNSKHLVESSGNIFNFPSPLIGRLGLGYAYSFSDSLGAFTAVSLLTSGFGGEVSLSPGYALEVGVEQKVAFIPGSSLQLIYGLLKQDSQLFALSSSTYLLNLQYEF